MNQDEFKGAWKEFREWERREHDEIKIRLTTMEEKIDQLREWKWKIVGGSAVVAAIVGGLFNVISLLK